MYRLLLLIVISYLGQSKPTYGPNIVTITKSDMNFQCHYQLYDVPNKLLNTIRTNNGYNMTGLIDYEPNDGIPITDPNIIYRINETRMSNETNFFAVTQNILSNNDRLVIQLAINNFMEFGGGQIYVSQGTYICDYLIYLGSRMYFKGDGIDLTILILQDHANPFKVGTNSRAGFVRTMNTNDITISDFTLNGNKFNQPDTEDYSYGRYGIYTQSVTNAWFNNVKIINFQGYGFDPHGHKPSDYGHNLTITNCISENNNWDGFTIDETLYANVENCTSISNGRHGFNIVTGSRYVTIKNSYASNNGYFGIYNGTGCGIMIQNNLLYGTGNVTVQYNTFTKNKKAGICLDDVYDIVCTNNTINGTAPCFKLTNVTQSTITNNVCIT